MSGENKKRKLAGGLFWSYGERITAQLVSLIVSIVLARLLDPEHYGVISIVMIFITFCNAFVTGGFGNSLVQKKDADKLDFNTMLYCSIIISLVLYVILYFCAPFIAGFYNMPIICLVLRVLGLRIPVSGINSIQHAWIQRKLAFENFFYATLIGTVLSAVVGIVMAYSGFGVWALVAQYLTNTIIDTTVLYIVDDWRPGLSFSWKRAKGLLSYGWKVLVTTLVYTLEGDLRSLIIGKRFGSSDLAYYDQGKKFPNLVVSNINSSISKVMFPVLSQNQNNMVRLKQMCRRAISTSTFLLAPLLIGLIAVADVFVSAILSTKWLPCVPYLRIMTVVYLVRPLTTTCQQSILAIGRSDITLKIQIIINIVAIGLLCIAVFGFQSVIMVAYGTLLAEGVSLLLFMYYEDRLIHYSFREQLNDMCPSLIVAFLMGMIVYFMHFLNINKYILLIFQVIVGGGIYIMVSALLYLEPFVYLVNMFNEKAKIHKLNKLFGRYLEMMKREKKHE